METQISIVRQIASTYFDLILQLKYHFLGPDNNFLYSANPFPFYRVLMLFELLIS